MIQVYQIATNLVEVSDLSSGQYSVNKNIQFKASMLRTDLCDYSDAYIVVKGTVTFEGDGNNNDDNDDDDDDNDDDDDDDEKRDKKLTFKNNVSSCLCILEINKTFIGKREDLDIVIPMYNS